jgi:AcrR family transcriptional regulator
MSPRPNVEEVRREEILRATCEVIAERGYAATRVADIARRSGTSSATVHYYFKTKQNVLTEALAFAGRRACEQHRDMISGLTSIRQQLVRLVEWQVPVVGELDTWTIWLEVWNEATRRESVKDAQQAAYSEWLRTLEEIIERGVASGEFRAVDATDVAAMLAALIDGLGLQVLAGRTVSPRRMRQLLLSFLANELFTSEQAKASVCL